MVKISVTYDVMWDNFTNCSNEEGPINFRYDEVDGCDPTKLLKMVSNRSYI